MRYSPYGETRWSNGTFPTDYRFTGQREEAALGLYHMGARFYDPALGRWLSADALVPRPGEPQAFNRYSYVNNNPLRYIDPSGHWDEEWAEQFEKEHGHPPTEQDWWDYQFSLQISDWIADAWVATHELRQLLFAIVSRSLKFGHMLIQIKFVGALMLLTILASCGYSDDQVFDDVLRSDCNPPCWRGIIPGETTRNEVVKLLGQEPKGDPSFPRMSWGNRRIKGGSVPQVRIWLDPVDVVMSITLAETNPQYTFGDVVEERGAPSSVMVNYCSPESDLGYIYLVYHKDGVAFATGFVPVLNRPWQKPSAQERVYQWIYFVPTSTDKMLLQEGIIPGCGLHFYSDSSGWLGFGQ